MAAAGVVVLVSCGEDGGPSASSGGAESGATATEGARLRPTPACDDGGDPTPEQTEGPFYTPDAPRRNRVAERGAKGVPLLLAGRVLDMRCRPVAGALLDFWQADGEGEYDNEGFRLRGHQFSDRSGRFALSTVVPGNYPGRTPHIHARVQPRDGKLLTTQLYFPGERGNEGDPLFDEALLLDLRAAGRGRRGRFDFVVA